MQKNTLKLLFLFFLIFRSLTAFADYNIVPQPIQVKSLKGKNFPLSINTMVVNNFKPSENISFSYNYLDNLIKQTFSTAAKGKIYQSTIILNYCDTIAPEGYLLEVCGKKMKLSASSANGIFYGIQSLRQVIFDNRSRIDIGTIWLNPVRIWDAPHFSYRGLLIDVVRHFYTVEELKQFMDIMAMHKINILHLHLTDDQGWRIEIKEYPQLTEIGSKREKTVIGTANVPNGHPLIYDGKVYSGFYTQDQIRDLIKYGEQRGITIIPEIEIPGHSMAALASYPQFGCKGKGYKVKTEWGITDDLYCAGNPETLTFLKNILKEVAQLFPSQYIHIGGDECPKDVWKICPKCQSLIKRENLKNEEELQSYVVREIEKYCKTLNKRIIGWDEILQGGVSPTATIMSWRGSEGGQAAASKGNYAIMCPTDFCYLDYYQTENRATEPFSIGGCTTIEKCYSFDPLKGISKDNQKYILGVQGNLWTEYIYSTDFLEYMILPRLAALSEVAWTYNNRDFKSFRNREIKLFDLYDSEGYCYATFLRQEVK